LVAYGEEDETQIAVHAHTTFHNAYVYIPAESMDKVPQLLDNAIELLKDSKAEVTQVSAPKITMEYKDQNTNIALAMAVSNLPKSHIYYTLDGTDPTTESAEYTEPLNVTSACTVKAVAIAEGYLLSEVASADVEIFAQPATPTIGKNLESGKTTVTLACETEGVDLWYNYQESNDTVKSMKYTEPLVMTAPTTLTAFAVVNGQVFSELATERIVIKDAVVRQDVVAHFDANTDEWGVNASGTTGSTVYHFSWGKNAVSIYDTTKEPIDTTTDPETGDVTYVYPEKDYEYWVPSAESAWELKSKGQVMIYQTLGADSDPGNVNGYNPETTGDIIAYAPITKQDIQFGGKTSGERCTGAIQ
ncbi:MAG: chitobiase/beta-hexosaminidase C-terminal domain-containing protein, partial [Prevotella sp.]|nr:chitobiase/beta-hexosaminidase C-terminal domain-containing protein [Prevotella sp.]